MTPITLGDIEHTVQAYATARGLLETRLVQLNSELEAARRRAMPLLKTALDATKAAESEVIAAINEGRHHFAKRRTVVAHGIRFGLEKGKGTVRIDDQANTIKLIKRHLPEQVDLLIKTKETPIKAAIAQLTGTDCKRIGVELVKASDQVVLRAVDSELEKLLKALLDADATPVDEDSEA